MKHKNSLVVGILGLMLSLTLTTWADHKVSAMEKVSVVSAEGKN